MMVQHQSNHHQLMDAFDFTDDDLAANRATLLTSAQTKRLSLSAHMNRRFGRCGVIVLLLTFGAIIAVLVGVRLTAPSPQSGPPWSLIGGLAGLLAGIVVYTIISSAKTAAQLANPRIQVRTGTAHLSSKTINHGRWHIYFLNVDGVRFQLPTKAQFAALKEGQTYQVYYIEYTPTQLILSIEVV